MACSEPRILALFSALTPLSSLSESERTHLEALPLPVAQSFVRHAFREIKNNPRGIFVLTEAIRYSSESELSAGEWFGQVNRVYEWLSSRGEWAPLTDILQYISCALEGSSLQCGHDLEWYLSAHGFSRSLKA